MNEEVLPDGEDLPRLRELLEGAVVDESTDPPFLIGAQLPNGLPDPAAFGGPTTATSNLQNPTSQVPSITLIGGLALGLLLLGLVTFYAVRRRPASV